MLNELDNYIILTAEKYNKLEEIREKIISNNRKIITTSAQIIHLLHRSEVSNINNLLSDVNTLISISLDDVEQLRDTGEKCIVLKILRDGVREYVEASLLYEFITKEQLQIDNRIFTLLSDAFIEGVFEFAGELRRLFLKKLIKRDLEGAKEALDFIELLYEKLSTITIKGFFISSFKRRLDLLRAQLDKSMENYIFSQYGVREAV
jgi:predicted translin family RNA/ssDNA-binding protein